MSHSHALKDRATQLLRSRSGALVTQYGRVGSAMPSNLKVKKTNIHKLTGADIRKKRLSLFFKFPTCSMITFQSSKYGQQLEEPRQVHCKVGFKVHIIKVWVWLFDNSYVSSWHPEVFQVYVRLWRKWSSWQKWFWGNAMIKDESYHFDLMAFSWSSKNHFCPQCLAVRNTIMEGKGSWNQEKWVLLNQVYRDWVLVDFTQLLLI